MMGDFIIQTDWMAANKLKSHWARFLHVTTYSIGFIPVALAFAPTTTAAWCFLLNNFIVHYVVDTRRWASGDKWPPKPIVVDQALHMTQLAILGVIYFGI